MARLSMATAALNGKAPIGALEDRDPCFHFGLPSSEAFDGLAGAAVRTLAPYTESSESALLLTTLTALGAAVCAGERAPYLWQEGHHEPRLYTAVVGDTSLGRKGTSWRNVRHLMRAAMPHWSGYNVSQGAVSGEGLAQMIAAAPERALLVKEEEFASVLRRMGREGNTLNEALRELWDSNEVRVGARKNPIHVVDAHLSLLVQITPDELGATLRKSDVANGFANRFLYCWSERSQVLPYSPGVPEDEFQGMATLIADAVQHAQGLGEMAWSSDGRDAWAALYRALDAEAGGDSGLGAVAARAPAQCLRLAMLYAVLDGERCIGPRHVRAAEEIWRYSLATLHRLHDRFAEDVDDEVYRAVQAAGGSLTQTELNRELRKYDAAELRGAVERLRRGGMVEQVKIKTGKRGRPAVVWQVVD